MKSFKEVRQKLDEYRIGDNPTTQNPSDKAFLNKHLVLQYKNLSIPVSDDNVFNAANITQGQAQGGKRQADQIQYDNHMDGYNTPVLFGDYVNYLMSMRAANESVELDNEENALIETVLAFDNQEELKTLLDTELTEDFEIDLVEAHHIPLRGHPYHKKPNEHLHYIIKDAGEAAENMKGHNEKAENKYRDQVNDAHTVLGYRKRHGHSIGYHRAVKEGVELEESDDWFFDDKKKKDKVAKKNRSVGGGDSKAWDRTRREIAAEKAKKVHESEELEEMTSSQIRAVWEKAARAKAGKNAAAREAIRKADDKNKKVVKESIVPSIPAKKTFSDYVKSADAGLKKIDKATVDGAKAIDDTFAAIKKSTEK